MSELQIYQNDDGSLQLNVQLQDETLWLSQAQMAQLFGTSIDNIGLHIRNIFKSQELNEPATTEDFSVVRQEGKRQVKRRVKYYNLDVIISVGYRVNSVNATRFRQWATATLKQHLVKGYSLNQQRLSQNAAELEKALQLVKQLLLKTTNFWQKPVLPGCHTTAAALRLWSYQRFRSGNALPVCAQKSLLVYVVWQRRRIAALAAG
jgi:hypothetical protein